jgi:AcrR family transcriptional regulator
MSTKDLILDTAEDLFNHHGYTHVGVDLIRDTSGVSKTTIYRYFSDKDGLILATLNRRHKRFSDSLSSSVNKVDGVERKLLSLLSWHYEWFGSERFDGCMFMHALSEFKSRNKDICDMALEHKSWVKDFIRSILKENKQLYHDSKVDIIMNTIEGLIITAEFYDKPPSIKTFEYTFHHIVNSSITSLKYSRPEL